MVSVALKCPFCGSEAVHPYGTSNDKKRYAGTNPACAHKTWYVEYRYNDCKPEVKRDIIKWAIDEAGIGATAFGESVFDTIILEHHPGIT